MDTTENFFGLPGGHYLTTLCMTPQDVYVTPLGLGYVVTERVAFNVINYYYYSTVIYSSDITGGPTAVFWRNFWHFLTLKQVKSISTRPPIQHHKSILLAQARHGLHTEKEGEEESHWARPVWSTPTPTNNEIK